MYEQSARWNEYYRELNPSYRRQMLDKLCMTEPDDGANLFRLQLWEQRHRDDGRDGEVDRFLFQCVNLVQAYRTARWFRRSAARQTRKVLQGMLFEEAFLLGEAGERALYWELRNVAARYLKTCEGSGYNRAMFGMVASGDASRSERICREIWEMTRGLAARTGLENEMRIWNQAILDAYSMFDGNAEARMAELDRGR